MDYFTFLYSLLALCNGFAIVLAGHVWYVWLSSHFAMFNGWLLRMPDGVVVEIWVA